MFTWHVLFCKYYSVSSLHIQLKRISVQQCCYCKSNETLKICNRRFEIPVQTSITLVETQILMDFFNVDYFNSISWYCLWEIPLVFQLYPKTITNLLHSCFITSCVTGSPLPPAIRLLFLITPFEESGLQGLFIDQTLIVCLSGISRQEDRFSLIVSSPILWHNLGDYFDTTLANE